MNSGGTEGKTIQLLNCPRFRKNLSNVLQIDETDTQFVDAVKQKLAYSTHFNNGPSPSGGNQENYGKMRDNSINDINLHQSKRSSEDISCALSNSFASNYPHKNSIIASASGNSAVKSKLVGQNSKEVLKKIGFISFEEYQKSLSNKELIYNYEFKKSSLNKGSQEEEKPIVSLEESVTNKADQSTKIDYNNSSSANKLKSNFRIPSYKEYLESVGSSSKQDNKSTISNSSQSLNQILTSHDNRNCMNKSNDCSVQMYATPLQNEAINKVEDTSVNVSNKQINENSSRHSNNNISNLPRSRSNENVIKLKSDSSRSQLIKKPAKVLSQLEAPLLPTKLLKMKSIDETATTSKNTQFDPFNLTFPKMGGSSMITKWSKTFPRKASMGALCSRRMPQEMQRTHARSSFKVGDCSDASQDLAELNNNDVRTTIGLNNSFTCSSLSTSIKCNQKMKSDGYEAIKELLNTEVSYGKDLEIIKNEFYDAFEKKFKVTTEQLEIIFLNLDDLIILNKFFVEKFLCAFNYPETIGKMMQDCVKRLKPFEIFCIYHSCSNDLLEKLVQERELLPIFLHQLQKESQFLRRMDLKSFLIKPVQRITKYPLILERILKCMSQSDANYNDVTNAKEKLESTLATINSQTICSIRTKRPSLCEIVNNSPNLNHSLLTQISFDALKWRRSDTSFKRMGILLLLSVSSYRGLRETNCSKFQAAYCVIASRTDQMVDNEDAASNDATTTAFIIIRERGKENYVEDILMLDRLVVSSADGNDSTLLLDHIHGNCYIAMAEKGDSITQWAELLRSLTCKLGVWRSRRNALANAMLPDTLLTDGDNDAYTVLSNNADDILY